MQVQERAFHQLFLERVFAVLLNRVPDPESATAFLALLEGGTSRTVVIEDILTSPEYVDLRKTSVAFVEDLYRVLLRRDPSPSDGVADWADFAHAHGRRATFEAFLQTLEARLRISETEPRETCRTNAGVISVVFLRDSVLFGFGEEYPREPLKVTVENWPALRGALNLLGLTSLSCRIEHHLQNTRFVQWD